MASLGNPKSWVPYMDTKDCSQGFCSLYCPQWCYLVLPPPPPVEFPDDDSSPRFSPLVIAIIGILASAFLLVSYYAIVNKYCRNPSSSARRDGDHQVHGDHLEINHNPVLHEPWHLVGSNGLDEALIRSIAVCKYKKGDGLIEGTDCAVCLSEFQDDESLRLLPKCSHAFHQSCIDTWLKSHSNCPLCRANIVSTNGISPPPLPAVATESSSQDQRDDQGENISNRNNSDSIIEIATETDLPIRRSFSVDFLGQNQYSIADILRINDINEDAQAENGAGSSKGPAGDISKSRTENKMLHSGLSTSAAMRRSFSSGRFFSNGYGRWQQNANIPV